ncbi:unnamed protein product [Mytilus coruscus]|uniref:Uncharacterized protein n=1 Tax=Mytilus coruscus TaxID=42192 RepID=A0A6J8DGD7_MYTCO|nr:unnamed protein product [Mytilus coruscus]
MDPLPRSSITVQKFAVITGSNLLEKLGNGSLNMETASRKRRKIGVKYHSEDIEKCYNKVRRLSNTGNPTITDLENSLDETQGTPRKKKFDELEEVIIRQQDIMRRDQQIIESFKQNREEVFLRIIQWKDEERIRCIQEEVDRLRTEKDEEIRRKDEERIRCIQEVDRLRTEKDEMR